MPSVRKSPSESATEFPEGTIKRGNDGELYVVKKVSNGTKRWMSYISVELFGFKALTVDYLAKHIGKTIVIYEREYDEMWPSKIGKLFKEKFIATGNAGIIKQKKILENWLKTRKPPIKDKTIFFIEGLDMDSLQVDSKNKKLVSSNIMNMEAFVKVEKK
jgi:hypothetical protein